jgi:hypothetical protein
MPERRLTLATFKGGALDERFQLALTEVLANIQDPNTPRAAKRGITIKFTFTPAEGRKFAGVKADVTCKLAGTAPIEHYALFREDEEGEMFALEPMTEDAEDPRQMALVHDIENRRKQEGGDK